MKIQDFIQTDLIDASNTEIYQALIKMINQKIEQDTEQITGERKLYYLSFEFLIGKLLSNNLINLHLYDEVRLELQEANKSILDIEEIELEPSLGNGGLGRLAACFIDSIASLKLNGDGVGLLYHYGLFRQSFDQLKQSPQTNPWLKDNSFVNKTDTSYQITMGNKEYRSRMYEINVLGYNNAYNKLKLFDLETVNEDLVQDGINFDQENIAENLTLFLYPDDSNKQGELLRIYQQYFLIANTVNLIFEEEKAKGHLLCDLHKHVVIQINDTHPTLVIVELINRLCETGIEFTKAIKIVEQTCAYTNHTILSEALEKWNYQDLQAVIPQLMPIIDQLDAYIRSKYSEESVYIIDPNRVVHMANICIHFSFSINGVAKLHSNILIDNELNNFYQLYPEKFNNKTNGITFRRWLMYANPELKELLDQTIGTDYHQDSLQLEKLLAYKDNPETLEQLRQVKSNSKRILKEYILQHEGIEINENSIFDIQIKRLHEYKRQQMNLLYIIYKYLEVKQNKRLDQPITFIFGAKAAPAYTIAQDIIHALLVLAKIIEKDPEVSKFIKLVFVENYNVSYAEKLIPACDVSEQISLASKEASGTGNMKFMLNGAITLGTLDGANVEINDLVKEDNIYIFGKSSAEIIKIYEENSYRASDYYHKTKIKPLVDFINGSEMLVDGDQASLDRLHHELITKDWFMTLLDLEAYIQTKDKCFSDYQDQQQWVQKSMTNIAMAGYFSSDRTIADYEREIWKLKG